MESVFLCKYGNGVGMICPECNKNHQQKLGVRCECGYRFVFNPAATKGLTDDKFLDLVRQAGENDRYYFTFARLYGVWCRSEAMETFALLRLSLAIICIVLFFIIYFCFSVFGWIGGVISMSLLVLPCLILEKFRHRKAPDEASFSQLAKKWCATNGVPARMLLKPALREPPPEFSEQDLYDYGVERIFIVNRPLLVDLLVRNNFHAEQRALVFCRNGYPSYIADQAKKILEQSPDLPVFLLHDANDDGLTMADRITVPVQTVVDLGVTPGQIKELRVLSPLQLEHKEYRAFLDVIPHATLSALCTAAIADDVGFEQVLQTWTEGESVIDNYFMTQYGKSDDYV